MSYFKKFTDFSAGVAAFAAVLLLIRRYMMFDADELLLDEQSKLMQFMENPSTDVTMYLHLLFFFGVALAAGIIFRRLPYICLLFSLPSVIYITFMFSESMLYEQAALFLAAAALMVVGNLAECAWRDKEDGRHRLFVASKIASGAGAAACMLVFFLAQNSPDESVKPFVDMNSIEREIFHYTSPDDPKQLLILAGLFIGVLVIGLLLYNVYFTDAILSLIPLVYSLYLLLWEKLSIMPLAFVALAAVCAAANLMLAVFENNLSRKEQNKA